MRWYIGARKILSDMLFQAESAFLSFESSLSSSVLGGSVELEGPWIDPGAAAVAQVKLKQVTRNVICPNVTTDNWHLDRSCGQGKGREQVIYTLSLCRRRNVECLFPPAREEVAKSFLRFVEDSSSEGILNADKLLFYSEKKYRDHCP